MIAILTESIEKLGKYSKHSCLYKNVAPNLGFKINFQEFENLTVQSK